jgi:hypothetical protein
MIGQTIWRLLPNVYLSLPVIQVIIDCLGDTRLTRKVQRHTKNVLAGSQEVLQLLYIRHGENDS